MKKVFLIFTLLMIVTLFITGCDQTSYESTEKGLLQTNVDIVEKTEANSAVIAVVNAENRENRMKKSEEIGQFNMVFDGLAEGEWNIELWLQDDNGIYHVVESKVADIMLETTTEIDFQISELDFAAVIEEYEKLENSLYTGTEENVLKTQSVSDGLYRIISVLSDKAVEVENASTDGHANIVQYDYHGGSNQNWRIEGVDNGNFSVINENSGLAMEVGSAETDDGANVLQWEYNSHPCQQWEIIHNGGGEYSFINVNSGKALDVYDFSTENGGNIVQWAYWGGETQSFRVEPIDDSDTPPGETPSLYQEYSNYFPIGAAVNSQSINTHGDLLSTHFNSITAENEMKPDSLQPSEGSFNFDQADEMVNLALDQGMEVRGHTLVWHAQTPDWVFEGDRQTVINRMKYHIENVMTHFGSSIESWDVVNEAAADDGAYPYRQESGWYESIGSDFVRMAFEFADQFNFHGAKLYYNDYNAVVPEKRERIITILTDAMDAGAPIDGMGIQAHWDVEWPSLQDIEEAINAYANLGLKIQITELDIGMEGHTEREQAQRYREIFDLFRQYSHVIEKVTIWGVADDDTWRPSEDPLLFDENHEPKEAFWELVN